MSNLTSLTKENFWDALMKQFPNEMNRFCTWIDEYKKRVDWSKLFNYVIMADVNTQQSRINYGKRARLIHAPKYHDLPIAMQVGIFIQYSYEVADDHHLPFIGDEPPQTMQEWADAIKEWICYEEDLRN